MTHGKNKNIIYSNMRYNRYMTDDRNRKSGEPVSKKNSKFCNYDNCNKTAIYNYWGIGFYLFVGLNQIHYNQD